MTNTNKKPCRLGSPNRRNVPAMDRTTCALSRLSDARVEHARLWLLDESGRAVSKQAFISMAVDSLTRDLLKSFPGFKLPPSCAFTEVE